jgi:hypothetical protein
MTATAMSSQIWTAAEIDLALVHIRTALASLRRSPGTTDPSIDRAVNEARQLEPYLEHNPRDCTPEGLACCRELLATTQT